MDNYHSDHSRASKSKLDKISRSPAHYLEAITNPTDTDPMRFGRMVHAYILEGEPMIVCPYDSFRTNEAKQWKEDNPDFIKRSEVDAVNKMRDAVHDADVHAWLKDGEAERTYEWDDSETGAPCKCRVDWITSDGKTVVDLKTTNDASERGFISSARKFRYDVQSAFYLDGIEEATGVRPERFVFMCVEKDAPYAVGLYEIDSESVELARLKYQDDLRVWQECRTIGYYPGYTNEIVTVKV